MKNKLIILASVIGLAILLAVTQAHSAESPQILEESTLHLYTPQAFHTQEMLDWNKLNESIMNTKSKYIVIHVTGTGGDISIGRETVDAIKEAQRQGKKIKLVIADIAASMHATLICYADSVVYKKDALIVFHAVTINFKPAGMANRITMIGVEQTHELLQPCVDRGILTEKEMDKMIDGMNLFRYYIDNNGTYKAYEERRKLAGE